MGKLSKNWGERYYAALEHLDDRGRRSFAIFDEFTLSIQIEGLKEDAESRENEQILFVDRQGEAHLPLFEQLQNLKDPCGGIGGGVNRPGDRLRSGVTGQHGNMDE